MSPLLRVAASVLIAALVVGPVSLATASAASKTEIAQATSANGTLTGTVLNAGTNKPVGDAAVIVQGSNGLFTATTNGDGKFTLSVPAGVYDITVNKGGFQPANAAGYPVAAGVTNTLQINLTEASSTTLRTIGSVSVRGVSALNTTSTSITTMGNEVINRRDLPNLEDTVSNLPGVYLARTTASTANLFFTARGAWAETKVNIEGHPLSPGTFGTWNANYAQSGIFDQIEVLKGAGLNGPTAGESVFGTVNIRTRDFSSKNYVELKGGFDSFAGGLYSAFGNVNLLNNRLSILAGKSFSGFNGPSNNYFANRIGLNSGLVLGTYQVPSGFLALDNYIGDLSDRYSLEAELVKARYRLSPATSITAEFLGLQGQYQPQAGSYASLEGNAQLAACFNGAAPQTNPANCTVTSTYNPPYAQSQVGVTVPTYFFFPNSYIQNNEPQFSAELRTSFHNDTILVRPYAALVNRFISGDFENRWPGEALNGWFMVTNTANCQANFIAPTVANGGAKGPCFGQSAGFNDPAYIGAGAPPFPVVFTTTNIAPTCTVATPCWTTGAGAVLCNSNPSQCGVFASNFTTTNFGQANNGGIGYGQPFSQPEVDRLRGVTFQYLHPFGDNLVGFSYDYHADDTASVTSDTTPIFPGCTAVTGNAVNTVQGAGVLGVQPGCALTFLPRTSIAIPSTKVRVSDYALTGLFQVLPALQVGLGAYYEHYNSLAQTEDPAVLANFTAHNTGVCLNPTCTATGTTAASAPVSLIAVPNSFSHFDPHVTLSYRATPDFVIRANGGSAVTMPYAFLISSVGNVTIPNAANNQTYTQILANTALLPETTVAYDLGMDLRLPDGAIVSLDGYNNTVHNIFMSQTVGITCPPSVAAQATGGCFQSQTVNGPIGRYRGIEVSLSKNVPVGFGYSLTTSFERAYLDQLPLALYVGATAGSPNALVNGKQLDSGVLSQQSVPYTKGYAELRWSAPRTLLTFGMDYEGANNSTYGPGYTVFNSTARWEVTTNTTFQIAADNVFNYNSGPGIVRALFGQGNRTIGQYLSGGQLLNSTLFTPKSIQQIAPRTVRFTLSRRISD